MICFFILKEISDILFHLKSELPYFWFKTFGYDRIILGIWGAISNQEGGGGSGG